MTHVAVETRHHYIDESLARATEWLQDDNVRRILGADAVASIELSMGHLYVPNLGRVGNWYVTLHTPTEYVDETSLPIMAGFPGDRFIPDGPMMRQTRTQRDAAIQRLSEVYGDDARAARVVEGHDERLKSQGNGTKIFHVSRYDTDASTHMAPRKIGPEQQRHVTLGRLLVLFTMGDMDEGYTVASPVATIHEFLHVQDYLGWGCIAVDAIRTHMLSSEFRSFHYGSRVERYAIDSGLVRPDEWGDYNRVPGQLTYSERFEAIRAAHASPEAPFAANAATDEALVGAGLL